MARTGSSPGGELAPPDIILIGAEWRDRAMLCAQLIEEGYDVLAFDEWPIPRAYRRAGMKPRLMIIDLRGLLNPLATLDEVRFVIPPDRVLVLTALGTVSEQDIRRLGFAAIQRPTSVAEVVAGAVARLRLSSAFKMSSIGQSVT